MNRASRGASSARALWVGRYPAEERLSPTPARADGNLQNGKSSCRWRVTLADLQRWTAAYGLPFPAPLAAPGPGSTSV